MADRIADNADLIVDEMKRKARRRLVGAIVLALAAAIVLPMLLEKEPRSLGEDVSVQIPPVDDAKFVNRLTGKGGDSKPAPKVDDKPDSKSAPPKSEPKPESAVGAASPAPMAPPAVPAPPGAMSGESSAPNKQVVEAEQPAPSSAPPASPAANAATPVKAEGFVVQLAAYADDKGANALVNKLKRIGYLAYVEPVSTSRGTLWRVRVGGYGSRPDADAARAKLKGEGFSGIVAPAT